jgi:hypothetical protein
MTLSASSATPSPTTLSPSLAAARVRAAEQRVGWPAGNPISRLPMGVFAYLAASFIMALMVAVAALAMEQPPAPIWIVGDATTAAPDEDAWCKTLNGRTICVGEPN